MNNTDKSYDVLPYPSSARKNTHPYYLRSAAALSGFCAPLPDGCRVLEIGCSDAGNMLNMAQTIPTAHFLGIDISEREIEAGRAAIMALGLKNIEIEAGDIMEFDALRRGPFDYIIVHGIYSWVPEFVRRKILDICREALSPQGVAFISYNANPGCRLRDAVRDLARYAVRGTDSLHDAVAAAREAVETAKNLNAAESEYYSALLERECKMFGEVPDSFVAHDVLETVNRAFYFKEFAADLADANLEHFGDSTLDRYRIMYPPAPLADKIARLSGDFYRREQQIDFFIGRQFRESLVCRYGISSTPEKLPPILFSMRIVSRLCASDKFVFSTKNGGMINAAERPLLRGILQILQGAFPVALTLEEIHCCLQGEFPDALPEQILLELLECYRSLTDSVEFLTDVFPVAAELPEFPVASPVARFQMRGDGKVSTLLHETIEINPIQGLILQAADGTRRKSGFGEYLLALFDAGELEIGGAEDASREVICGFLERTAGEYLDFLVKNALILKMPGEIR